MSPRSTNTLNTLKLEYKVEFKGMKFAVLKIILVSQVTGVKICGQVVNTIKV